MNDLINTQIDACIDDKTTKLLYRAFILIIYCLISFLLLHFETPKFAEDTYFTNMCFLCV